NEYSADLEQSGQITPIASAPLAAGNYILVRTPHGLLAVDFRTGKRIWRSELQRDPQLEQLVKSGGAPEDAAAAAPPARSFVRRVWKDYLYGLISSDGDRVFMIRDLPLPEDQEYELSTGGMGMELVAASNRLTAYDLTREGKLAWEIDGAAEDGPLGGAFFLGAPLAVGPSLYALVEIRGDISLAALDRTTGAVQWRQQLANLDSGVMMDMRRRLQSLAPSYDGGILVCPTGAGLVVGVDLSQRSLAWAYQFASLPQAGQMPRSARVRGDAAVTPGQWMDGAATIADGRVLLTPPESDELHCLDLQTGRLLWQRPRGEMQQLASVQQGRILLVGPGRMASMKLADGSFAWDAPLVLPQGASVTGAGFVSDGCYFAPLSTSEVVQVDLATGAIVGRVQNRGGAPLGNLICHRGTVISHDGRFLDCYDQVDALRERSAAVLAANPEGPDALRALGEIAYNEGRLSEALELLERGYRLAPDDLATREMLAECLGAALDEDFAAYRSRLPLLRQLQAEGAIALLDAMRLEAQGLTTVGDFDGALAACLKIYREAPPLDERYAFRSGHRTFISHWVQAQLLTIRDAAPAEMQRVLDDLVRAEATRLGDQPTLEPLQRFIAYFGALQAAEPQKLTYGHALGVRGQILESQQCLLDLASSKDRAIRREAVAAIAAQLHQPPRPTPGLSTLAREFDALLATEFANEPCLQGATGRELTSRWAESDAQAGAPATIAWPRGRVEVRPLAAPATAAIREGGPRGRSPVWNVRLDQTDSMLGGGTGFLSMRGGNLAWQDGYGRQFFTTPLEARSQAMYRQSGSLYASSRGNLLVVSLGRELVAFNTLANQDGGALLWRAALGNNFEAEDVYLEEVSGRAERRPGSYRAPRAKFQNKWTGVIGPVTSGGCVYQEGRRLSCVSPVTGEEIWSRRDVEEGSDLFGDERRLFATPKGGTVAQVFSMLDGRRLAEVELPPWRHQLATRGGAVLRWKAAEQGMELAALDALTGTIDWRHAFAAGARVDIDQNRTIAVVEPAGRCVLIDGADGKVLLEQRLPGHSRLEAVHLSVGVESYVLVIEHPPSGNTDRTVRPFNADDSPVVDGQVAAFDRRSGAMLWQRPATVQRQALIQGMPPDLPFIAFAG
ncbi:MAG TPA: PQQ-binding-like beta-propeller repeat protein, partial [Lacipirellulaceae bacterium]|nr:PQQ-binding-like beta-propeller repeat protein [Lacipirellulaceae bacterium]